MMLQSSVVSTSNVNYHSVTEYYVTNFEGKSTPSLIILFCWRSKSDFVLHLPVKLIFFINM